MSPYMSPATNIKWSARTDYVAYIVMFGTLHCESGIVALELTIPGNCIDEFIALLQKSIRLSELDIQYIKHGK